ncbi:MAG: hypothetical protein WBE84_21600, partial [Xanthobacteraceae bacterium]
ADSRTRSQDSKRRATNLCHDLNILLWAHGSPWYGYADLRAKIAEASRFCGISAPNRGDVRQVLLAPSST